MGRGEEEGWVGVGGRIVELDQSLPGRSWDDLFLFFFFAHFDMGLVKTQTLLLNLPVNGRVGMPRIRLAEAASGWRERNPSGQNICPLVCFLLSSDIVMQTHYNDCSLSSLTTKSKQFPPLTPAHSV